MLIKNGQFSRKIIIYHVQNNTKSYFDRLLFTYE